MPFAELRNSVSLLHSAFHDFLLRTPFVEPELQAAIHVLVKRLYLEDNGGMICQRNMQQIRILYSPEVRKRFSPVVDLTVDDEEFVGSSPVQRRWASNTLTPSAGVEVDMLVPYFTKSEMQKLRLWFGTYLACDADLDHKFVDFFDSCSWLTVDSVRALSSATFEYEESSSCGLESSPGAGAGVGTQSIDSLWGLLKGFLPKQVPGKTKHALLNDRLWNYVYAFQFRLNTNGCLWKKVQMPGLESNLTVAERVWGWDLQLLLWNLLLW